MLGSVGRVASATKFTVDVEMSPYRAKRSDNLNRFYTRGVVGRLIASELAGSSMTSIVDLGVGEGSLVRPLLETGSVKRLVTVDLDPAVAGTIRGIADHTVAHQHFTHDAMDPSLPLVVGQDQFDVAVCNPPFFRPKWERRFADILHAASFEEAFSSISEVTAEGLFLAQNLRLVREGGIIALIVPDSLVTARRAQSLRRVLVGNHRLMRAIQLPPNAFHDTDARCFVLIIRRGLPASDRVELLSLSPEGKLSDGVFISPRQAAERLDHSYYAQGTDSLGDLPTLRALGAEIRRGSLSSVQVRAADFSVLHTPDLRSEDGLIDLPGGGRLPPPQKLVVAEPGDILIARVDRRLHEKIAWVQSGVAALSDCIYRVRVKPGAQAELLAALRSEPGQAAIKARTKGVGARLLGKADLLDLPLRAFADHVSPK